MAETSPGTSRGNHKTVKIIWDPPPIFQVESRNICIYVNKHMYIYIYICMYTCKYIIYVKNIFIYVCTCTHRNKYIKTYLYVCTCIHMYIYIYTCVYTYVCININIHLWKCMCIHTYIIITYTYVCIVGTSQSKNSEPQKRVVFGQHGCGLGWEAHPSPSIFTFREILASSFQSLLNSKNQSR